jgi:predicted ABC-type ATPase
MSSKRLRVFAGPNGSGKTTIINKLRDVIPYGVYVNADDIESNLKISKILIFNTYQLQISEKEIQTFFKNSTFAPIKRNENDLWKKLTINENILFINTFIDSYLAADIAEFIRQQLLFNGISFTFETVMSHKSKIDFLQIAQDMGYRVYFYYVATEDPSINISRVKIRVSQNGHDVKPEIIENRYYKSLENLKDTVLKTNRAYFWDTSSGISNLIAEITNGKEVEILEIENIPNWLYKYLLDK